MLLYCDNIDMPIANASLALVLLLRQCCALPNRPSSSSAAAPFVYLNRANMTFRALQIPRLIRSKDATDLFPLPLRLLANYLPQQTLELLNELHGELHKCGRGETRDVCVKTLHDGWVLGKKAEMTQREFYAFFDTKVPSVVDLSGASHASYISCIL